MKQFNRVQPFTADDTPIIDDDPHDGDPPPENPIYSRC